MKSNFNLLCLVFIFLAIPVFAQEDKDDTIFITSTKTRKKEKSKDVFVPFTQLAFSIPLKATPDNDFDDDPDNEVSVFDYVLPDGIGAHFGYGIFYNYWLGISANAGVDHVNKQRLFAAPVYAMLTITGDITDERSILLQAGLGHAFALGRGDLSGTYQKYHIGISVSEKIYLFAEANLYGFSLPYRDINKAGSLNFGISFLNLID
ncbi:MAG: hypothetical protein BM557_02435 [Flavobacterium sp. MedPE-SWcel]|uniref:hypothetical protein n=1 Tax=uncultured Flavobacterium sp. TaxID=165435 RepID=UPI00091BEC27|nr:hypothetical protein [uncultured Flavobacterium sp.]OIQ21675.1 MAG: hypothetical protein BM557_02435 [Flavobacterium sp. MedPE-SWcel]